MQPTMEENKSPKKDYFILGLLIGAAAGAAVGLLYAPREGKEMRRRLSFQLSKVKEKLTNYLNSITNGTDAHISIAKTKGEQVVNESKEKAEKLLNEVESLLRQVKK